MKLLQKDIKHGIIKAVPQSQDDLWLLGQIIMPGALVSGITTRKVKISDKKVDKKTYFLQLNVEKISYENDLLRVSGKVMSEVEDIPKGSSHTISLGINDDVKIEQKWLAYQIEKIENATKAKAKILIVVLDREDVYFAQLMQEGYKLLSNFEGDVEKKVDGASSKGGTNAFYQDVAGKIKEYDERMALDRIIIASPAFFKDDFMKQLKDGDLRKKIILATCSSVSENAFSELLKREEVKQALQNERIKEEVEIMDKFFLELAKEGKCTYGPKEVKASADNGAISSLLVSTAYINKFRENEKFSEIEDLITAVENSKGKAVIISSSNEAGKRLDGIGGIAALLRYKAI